VPGRIAPQRPCTNGIAERLVRTVKEWLETHSWNSPEDRQALLAEFIAYYNNRPHNVIKLGLAQRHSCMPLAGIQRDDWQLAQAGLLDSR